MENEEVMRRNMEHTRESLTDKLETLENKLLSSVHQATSAVNQTVASVKETMSEGVESVKDAVDIPAHVDRHPWLALGGSVLCGYMLGSMFGGGRAPRQAAAPLPLRPASSNGSREQATHEPAPAAPPKAGWLDALEPEIRHLKGLALGATLGTLREMLSKEVPPHMAEQLRDIIDAVTKKLGGEPVPSSDWAALKAATPPPGAERECGEIDTNKPRW
jgi:ElaB/YqjD/DUF883 family membrane-anchored ribosome-binding protein